MGRIVLHIQKAKYEVAVNSIACGNVAAKAVAVISTGVVRSSIAFNLVQHEQVDEIDVGGNGVL
jgi:hypothetical protein